MKLLYVLCVAWGALTVSSFAESENVKQAGKKLGATQASRPTVQDPVVLVVDGKKVKLSELMPQLIALTGGNFRQFSNEQMIRMIDLAKRMYVMQGVILKESLKRGYDKNATHKAAFDKAKENACVSIYMDDLSKSVTESRLNAAYDKHIRSTALNDYSFKLIVVKDSKVAGLILESVSQGVSFAKLAKEKSEHASGDREGESAGLIDFVREDYIAQGFGSDFLKKLKALSIGAIKQIQLSDGRFSIVKLENKRKAAPQSKKELEAFLRQQIVNEQLIKMTDDMIAKGKVTSYNAQGQEEKMVLTSQLAKQSKPAKA